MRLDAPLAPRRRVPLTPLVDVVFLLLLFFMLASVFDRYSEIDLAEAGSAPATQRALPTALVRLRPGGLDLNARALSLAELTGALAGFAGGKPARVVIRVSPGVSVQRLVDVRRRVDAAGVRDVTLSRG